MANMYWEPSPSRVLVYLCVGCRDQSHRALLLRKAGVCISMLPESLSRKFTCRHVHNTCDMVREHKIEWQDPPVSRIQLVRSLQPGDLDTSSLSITWGGGSCLGRPAGKHSPSSETCNSTRKKQNGPTRFVFQDYIVYVNSALLSTLILLDHTYKNQKHFQSGWPVVTPSHFLSMKQVFARNFTTSTTRDGVSPWAGVGAWDISASEGALGLSCKCLGGKSGVFFAASLQGQSSYPGSLCGAQKLELRDSG